MLSRTFALLALVAPTVSACSFQKDPEEDFNSMPTITSFDVVRGSSTLAPGDGMRVGFGATGPDMYHFRLYLSLDGTRDDTDHHLAGRNCGGAFEQLPGYDCSGIDCVLQAEPDGASFLCGDPESVVTYPVRVAPFLGSPGGSATLIGEACNPFFTACDVATIPLTFHAG
jgi:hypothetical protein